MSASESPPLKHGPQLCENGLLWNVFVVPWQRLKVIRRGLFDPLYLQISCYGIRKIIRVRADQREQVETILRTHATGFIQSPKTSHSKD
ncbi:hypothetical protein Enr8_12470 [Blastopirellula retiformator]|uniref:Uncharacterized protein n=1 Tax=Blastopirellula retiformator TaxID=2527970 RepID=A0A5C5VNA1_9BACT|nr:hypothetical protein Enr8_12470 [Blastopirellula retiformator]